MAPYLTNNRRSFVGSACIPNSLNCFISCFRFCLLLLFVGFSVFVVFSYCLWAVTKRDSKHKEVLDWEYQWTDRPTNIPRRKETYVWMKPNIQTSLFFCYHTLAEVIFLFRFQSQTVTVWYSLSSTDARYSPWLLWWNESRNVALLHWSNRRK